jgi:hypothetical protein
MPERPPVRALRPLTGGPTERPIGYTYAVPGAAPVSVLVDHRAKIKSRRSRRPAAQSFQGKALCCGGVSGARESRQN